MKRSLSAVILTVSLFSFFSVMSVWAGGSSDAKDTAKAEEQSLTIVDDRGESVVIEGPVEGVATFPLPHPHIIAAIDGNLDRVTGASSMSVSAAKVSVLGKMYPEFLNVNTSFLKGLKLNLEELVKINPDVFFTDKVLEGMENLGSTGIPTVYMGLKKEKVPYLDGEAEVFSPKVTMDDWVDYTSKVMGKNESNALEIADLWAETEEDIHKVVGDLPASQRPKVLIIFKAKALLIAGDGTFGDYWIARTGGINAAEDLKGTHPAFMKLGNFEDILRWNPDIVYLSNFEDTMPEDLYNNTIDGQDWSQVSAVVKKQVYRIPLGIYRWYPPSLDGPLMLKWMAQKNFPDLFKYDMGKELQDYFKKFHHYDLSDAEVKSILNPASSGNL